MSPDNSSDSEPPHRRLQRRRRKTEIRKRLQRIREEVASGEAASEEASSDFWRAGVPIVDPPTEQEVIGRGSLEASQRQAAAKRKQEWEQLQNELHEIGRRGRAQSPSRTQRRSGNWRRRRDQAIPRPPQQGPQLDGSDSDALPPTVPRIPASHVDNGLQPNGRVPTAALAVNHTIDSENFGASDADDELDSSDESGDIKSSDEDDKADASENPSANFPGTRWISKRDLDEQGLWNQGIYIDLFQSKATDALYFLDQSGEKIWLTDDNGECVFAQDQNLDRTITRSSPGEAIPRDSI